MIDYEAMARELARLEFWYNDCTYEDTKEFWRTKYQGAARMVEVITGVYPATLRVDDNTFLVYIGEYKAVINF